MKAKTTWAIDPGHSEIQLKVKHLGIANVSGVFRQFTGSAQAITEDLTGSEVYVEIDASSIDTNNTERDIHLRSDIFLNTGKSPKIVFSGTLLKEGDDYALAGNLTILGVTKSVNLDVEHTGTGIGRFGDRRTGYEVRGVINRKDFGMDFNLTNPLGNLVVGEQVKIQCNVEFVAQ